MGVPKVVILIKIFAQNAASIVRHMSAIVPKNAEPASWVPWKEEIELEKIVKPFKKSIFIWIFKLNMCVLMLWKKKGRKNFEKQQSPTNEDKSWFVLC